MSKREWLSLIILTVLIIFAVFRYHNRLFTETGAKIMMGTLVEVSLTSPQRNISQVLDETFGKIREYENKLSYYNEDGDLWQINHSLTDSVVIDEDFYQLLTIAGEYYEKTAGKYDVTISPLTDLWHEGRSSLPDPDSIKTAMSQIGFDKLVFTPTYLKKPVGMKINFGSIAKGYIIDKAVAFALDKGAVSGHINAGGDIRVFGSQKREQRIGIRHPRDKNRIIDVLRIADLAVVTSGDYERYFEVEGKRYHHIINPLTGYPVDDVFSVTIIAPDATKADVISTAVFLLTPQDAIELIKTIDEVEGIIYYQEQDEILSLRTEGIKKYLLSK